MKSYLFFLVAGMLTAANGATTVVDLQFDSLPSAQGFTYRALGSNSGAVETDHYTVNGTVLTQDTLGETFATPQGGQINYERNYASNLFTDVLNYRMDLTARVTGLENTQNTAIGSYLSFSQTVAFNRATFTLGITPTELSLNGRMLTPAGFDGAVFHDYRVAAEFVGNFVVYEVFYEGDSIYRSPNTGRGAMVNQISFGDQTGGSNSSGERTNFVVTTNVPEPSLGLLMLLASACFAGRRSRG